MLYLLVYIVTRTNVLFHFTDERRPKEDSLRLVTFTTRYIRPRGEKKQSLRQKVQLPGRASLELSVVDVLSHGKTGTDVSSPIVQ